MFVSLILRSTIYSSVCWAGAGMLCPPNTNVYRSFKGPDRASFEHASCHGHQCAHLQGKLEGMLITSKTTLGDKESMFASRVGKWLFVRLPAHTLPSDNVSFKHRSQSLQPPSFQLDQQGSGEQSVNAKSSSQNHRTGLAKGLFWWLCKDNRGGSEGWWSGKWWQFGFCDCLAPIRYLPWAVKCWVSPAEKWDG